MIVEVNELQKSFGNKTVLDRLSLSIPEASVYGLVGKNGAGKTTLLNILAGISNASAGECFISGNRIIKGQYGSGSISYLPDLPTFFDYLTVQEYIKFILSAHKEKHNSLSAIVEQRVQELGLNGNTKIKALSRGNKQKLGIFAAVITNPKVLILDEPTSALDPVGRREVMTLIRELRDQGMTILFSTHILSDLELVCDRIGFLHKGRIQREIDMNSESGQRAIVLTIQNCKGNEREELAKHLPNYHVEVFDQGTKLICNPIDGVINQEKLFVAISHLAADILSVKRVSRKDLEAIMIEVLSE